MSKQSLLSTFISLAFAVGSYAAIGPVTDLTISDAVVAPDGFSRAAIVVNGNMPGPIIAGKKVCDNCMPRIRVCCNLRFQGRPFQDQRY